jgi:hypothetical protein
MAETKIDITQNKGGVDGSASGYFKLGNMMIQWATLDITVSAGTNAQTASISFPVAFKAGGAVAITLGGVDEIGGKRVGKGYYGESNSGFTYRVETNDAGNFSSGGTDAFSWMAIGLIA